MQALLPQDVIVLLKLVASPNRSNWTYSELSQELGTSASQVFRSVGRAETARLLSIPNPSIGTVEGISLFAKPHFSNLTEFLVHGVKYCFPVERGGQTRGLPTAEAAAPLKQSFPQDFT
jgi:hypothetical protein